MWSWHLARTLSFRVRPERAMQVENTECTKGRYSKERGAESWAFGVKKRRYVSEMGFSGLGLS